MPGSAPTPVQVPLPALAAPPAPRPDRGSANRILVGAPRVGDSVIKSLAGTAVDEVMNVGGWKTHIIPKDYLGSTASARVSESKRKRDSRPCGTRGSYHCQAFESDSSTYAPKYV